MSHCKIISASSNEEWDNEIAQLPADLQDIHLTARYHRMYEENGDGEARLFVYRTSVGQYVVPFLLRPVPSYLTPSALFDIESAYGYSGPVSSSLDAHFLREADQAFAEYCRDEKVVTEFVRFHPLLSNQRFLAADSTMQVIHLRDYVAVDLTQSSDERWENYTPQNRNKIRKAEKAGYYIHHDRTLASYDDFVRIYLENMRQLKAAPQYYFSPAYFTALRRLALSDGALLLVKQNEKVEGAAIFLGSGRWAHYFLSSVTPEGRRNGVGNLLLHKGLNLAADRGCLSMHLGGGLSADAHDPLLVFKQNFSRQSVPFYIGKRVHDATGYHQLISAWEEAVPEAKGKYGSILQRYRWTKADLPETH